MRPVVLYGSKTWTSGKKAFSLMTWERKILRKMWTNMRTWTNLDMQNVHWSPDSQRGYKSGDWNG